MKKIKIELELTPEQAQALISSLYQGANAVAQKVAGTYAEGIVEQYDSLADYVNSVVSPFIE